jgi:aspartyl-tRNA(Asn)/glutamyl-tRNA(Gln) amidotransferase subunit C
MPVSTDDVRRLARLAHLDLSGDEERFARDLDRIVGFMADLDAVDTAGVPPMTHVLEDFDGPMREDDVAPRLGAEAVRAAAPTTDPDGHVTVPTVLGE